METVNPTSNALNLKPETQTQNHIEKAILNEA